ncbi:hypothetical protein RB195_013073 [Necator americanus]|uniref:Uncharacterized protein n=1 Tax=Necator americanus TaxID=51031 RepID=A0ABR1DUJ8_NECAM
MMLFVSHAKGGTTGLLWHAIGTNGRITGARSTSSKINGSQGDQGDQVPLHNVREDGHVIPEVLPFEVQNAIMPVKNSVKTTSPKPGHLKYLLIITLARLFTCYPSEFNGPRQWKTTKTVLLYRRETHETLATIAQSAYCLSSTSSSQE